MIHYLFVLFQWAVQGLGCKHAIGRTLQEGDGWIIAQTSSGLLVHAGWLLQYRNWERCSPCRVTLTMQGDSPCKVTVTMLAWRLTMQGDCIHACRVTVIMPGWPYSFIQCDSSCRWPTMHAGWLSPCRGDHNHSYRVTHHAGDQPCMQRDRHHAGRHP